jgi:hypothetical protein
MSAKRNSDLNNLNASLHSIISGDHESVNIPYADDHDDAGHQERNAKSSDSISSNEFYPEKVNYNTGRRVGVKLPYQNTTGNEASGESDTDDGEKRDKPGPLVSELSRAVETSNLGVMRRNSISMPVLNEMDLDQLRNLHIKACESSDTMEDSKESLQKITVSFPALNYHDTQWITGQLFFLLMILNLIHTKIKIKPLPFPLPPRKGAKTRNLANQDFRLSSKCTICFKVLVFTNLK